MRKEKTTFNGGSLGSCIDEERSKLRYVMWIAEISESSSLWTQLALLGIPRSMPAWVSLQLSFFYRATSAKRAMSWDGSWHLCSFKIVGEGAKGDFCFLPITTWCGNFLSLVWETKHLVRERNKKDLFLSSIPNSLVMNLVCCLVSQDQATNKTHSTCDLRSGKTTRWT